MMNHRVSVGESEREREQMPGSIYSSPEQNAEMACSAWVLALHGPCDVFYLHLSVL